MSVIESSELPTVLIVDDESSNIQILAQLLKSDYKVRFTTHGGKAVELALSQNPDIILLDVIMPDVDGYTVCMLLKRDERTCHIPVVFVTAKGEEQFEATGFEVGGVDYISKPIKPFLLKARVRTHVGMKRQQDMLKSLSLIDGLTGIANRRKLDNFLDQEWPCAIRRGSSSLSCILMDVDFFKRFNDGYGHQAGDTCLRQVAGALHGSKDRGTDLVARYGGEEFVCILTETPVSGAMQVAEKIQANVAALAIPHAYSAVSPFVTLSMGVATLTPTKDKTPATLLETADKQLYKAKQEGRNRICAIEMD